MSFGFEKPAIHHVHAITAEAESLPSWRFASLTLTFKDAAGNATELEVFLPKEREAFAREVAAAINDANVPADDRPMQEGERFFPKLEPITEEVRQLDPAIWGEFK